MVAGYGVALAVEMITSLGQVGGRWLRVRNHGGEETAQPGTQGAAAACRAELAPWRHPATSDRLDPYVSLACNKVRQLIGP